MVYFLQCPGKEVKVTWDAAKAPYNLLVVSADDPCGDALSAFQFHPLDLLF